MAFELGRLFWVHIHVFIVLFHFGSIIVTDEAQVPCYFILGDSLFDNGNNNNLATKAKVNYPPYGVDFPEHATGRFTNGRTLADIIGHFLGFKEHIPPFATATDKQIRKGVNYASGSSGIREETGSHLGERISLDKQLHNHQSTVSRLSNMQPNITFLKKCIYVVNMGNNDYLNNYFLPDHYNTSRSFNADEYAAILIQQYSQQLTTLYNLGGRKIAVFGLGKIGCIPSEIGRFGTNGKPCVEPINDAVQLFNDRLKSLVVELNTNKSDARCTFINMTSISGPQGAVQLPSAPCCKVREDWQCIPNSVPCPVRTLSIYFDGFHPTEVTNTVIGGRSFTRLSSVDASPWDISQLSRL